MGKKPSEKVLTDVELELMTVIWSLGEATAAEVQERLSEGRKLAYTSISTILRILEQKKILSAKKVGRGHIYVPILTKSEFESRTVKQVVEKVFEGTPVALVRQLLNSVEVTSDEISELKRLLSDWEKTK